MMESQQHFNQVNASVGKGMYKQRTFILQDCSTLMVPIEMKIEKFDSFQMTSEFPINIKLITINQKQF